MHGAAHARALGQAFLVTLLWSSSVVLIKIGLRDIPPLLFAGLRYGLALACLLPLLPTPSARLALRRLDRRDGLLFLALGLVQYALTQGAQFLSLSYLPAATVSLGLAFTPTLVALMSGVLLGERNGPTQWIGLSVSLAGALTYFADVRLGDAGRIGLLVCVAGLAANAGQTLLGRYVNRTAHVPPVLVTTLSMGIGASLLLGPSLAVEGLPSLSLASWAIIVWLAVVNTAFAFTLWNHTQRTLTAVETSLINTSMLVQIALLAWFVLGDSLTVREWSGIVLVLAGVLIVQLPKLLRRATSLKVPA